VDARWAPLFHVLRLEQPDLRLRWRAVEFPPADGSLLDGADAGLFVAPPREPGVDALELETSPLVVGMAAGSRLAAHQVVVLADIVGEPFVFCPDRHPEASAFWTLDEQRGGPPRLAGPGARTVTKSLELIASGDAVATFPATVAEALPHPGIVTPALRDGPLAPTCLVWREDDARPGVRSLVALARAMHPVRERHAGGGPGGGLRRPPRRR
jgi:DNA-binding transcriptional LysR family regulator